MDNDPFNISIGDHTGEELRRICMEAIAQGEAYDRSRREARKTRLKRILFALALIVAGSAATLCVSIVR